MSFIPLCTQFCWIYGGLKFFLCSDLFLLIIRLGHVRANPAAWHFERIMRRIQKSIIEHPIRSIRVFMRVRIFRIATNLFYNFFLLNFIQIPQNSPFKKEINIVRMRKQEHSNICVETVVDHGLITSGNSENSTVGFEMKALKCLFSFKYVTHFDHRPLKFHECGLKLSPQFQPPTPFADWTSYLKLFNCILTALKLSKKKEKVREKIVTLFSNFAIGSLF